VSKQGFQLEPIRHLGFGSETICPSRGTLDSAVKLSALAGKIGESIQGFHLQSLVLWFEDLLCGKHLNCRFEEEKTFLIWYVGGIERSPCVGRILQLWQHASLKLGVSLFHKPSSSSRTPSCWLLGTNSCGWDVFASGWTVFLSSEAANRLLGRTHH